MDPEIPVEGQSFNFADDINKFDKLIADSEPLLSISNNKYQDHSKCIETVASFHAQIMICVTQKLTEEQQYIGKL